MKQDYLTQIEKKGIHEFKTLLYSISGCKLRQFILFGSKAKGDFNEESDIDILIIIDKTDKRIIEQIYDYAFDVSFKYNFKFILSPHPTSVKRFIQLKDY